MQTTWASSYAKFVWLIQTMTSKKPSRQSYFSTKLSVEANFMYMIKTLFRKRFYNLQGP